MLISNPRAEWLSGTPTIDRAAPRLTWELMSPTRGHAQTAYRVQCGTTPGGAELWDSGKVTSPAQLVQYAGATLASRTLVYWRVRVWDAADRASQWAAARFEMGLLAGSDWGTAAWVGFQTGGAIGGGYPAPCVRKSFTVPAKTIVRARLYASALGLYRPFVNGKRIGQIELAPGWRDYPTRRNYETYDVTAALTAGATNVVGFLLGDGWYLGKLVENNRNRYGTDVPRGLCALYIDYADGTTDRIVSDASWKGLALGNRLNDIYDGATHDARLAGEFTSAALDETTLVAVSTLARGNVPLEALPHPPVRRQERLVATARTNPSTGVYILDFGQNHSGVPRIKIEGASAGAIVNVKFAEHLKKTGDGTLYVGNLRTAAQIDSVTCSGAAVETYEPPHTYHGFRYAQVTGYPGVPPLDAVTSSAVYSDHPEVGQFACSNAVMNRLWSAARWTFLSNSLALPTDCNQRDERLGWDDSGHLLLRSVATFRDSEAFYEKWLQDLIDSTVGGQPGDFAPWLSVIGRGQAGWGDAVTEVAWQLYQIYGDLAPLRLALPTAITMLPQLPYADGYNDYLAPRTNAIVWQYGWAYRTAKTIERLATVLGDAGTAAAAASAAAAHLATWQAQVAADGTVTDNTQTGYLIGFAFGLIPTAKKAAAFAKLVALIQASGQVVGLGGVPWVQDVLADNGRLDLAYSTILSTAAGSVARATEIDGLTTLPEQYDPIERQAVDDYANSYNHPSHGAYASWFMRVVAGVDLDPAVPGFANVVLRPRPGGGVTWANGAFDGPRGRIESAWTIRGTTMAWHVRVPPNSTGTLVLPPGYSAAKVDGVALVSIAGVAALSADPITAGARFAIPSGIYDLTLTA